MLGLKFLLEAIQSRITVAENEYKNDTGQNLNIQFIYNSFSIKWFFKNWKSNGQQYIIKPFKAKIHFKEIQERPLFWTKLLYEVPAHQTKPE